jgi:hypothetical protein
VILDLDREASQIGRGGPESGRSHLRINVPFSRDSFAIVAVTAGCVLGPIRWKRLLVSAVPHSDFLEYNVFEQLRERLS